MFTWMLKQYGQDLICEFVCMHALYVSLQTLQYCKLTLFQQAIYMLLAAYACHNKSGFRGFVGEVSIT